MPPPTAPIPPPSLAIASPPAPAPAPAPTPTPSTKVPQKRHSPSPSASPSPQMKPDPEAVGVVQPEPAPSLSLAHASNSNSNPDPSPKRQRKRYHHYHSLHHRFTHNLPDDALTADSAVDTLLNLSIGLLLLQSGFTHAEPVALDGLRRGVEEYMLHFLAYTRQSMASCRRTQPIPIDFQHALLYANIPVDSLRAYLKLTMPTHPAAAAEGIITIPATLPSPPPSSPPPHTNLPFLGPELISPTSIDHDRQDQGAIRTHIPKHFPTFPSKHTYQETPMYITRETDPRRIREKATEEGRLGEEALRRLARVAKEWSGSGSGADGGGEYRENMLWGRKGESVEGMFEKTVKAVSRGVVRREEQQQQQGNDMLHFLAYTRQSMASCRRTQPIPIDFQHALLYANIPVDSLRAYLKLTMPTHPAAAAEGIITIPATLPSPPPSSPPPHTNLPFLGPELISPTSIDHDRQDQGAIRTHIPKHFPTFPSKHTYQETPMYITRETDPRRIREKATEEGRLGEEALRRLARVAKEWSGSGSGADGGGEYRENMLWGRKGESVEGMFEKTVKAVSRGVVRREEQQQQQGNGGDEIGLALGSGSGVGGEPMSSSETARGSNMKPSITPPVVRLDLSPVVNCDRAYWRKVTRPDVRGKMDGVGIGGVVGNKKGRGGKAGVVG
ncbi:hypothetical protein PAAG_11605 [Paracoccidioides lutzii Pb01]|uniref:Transcription initiation factor TFIID subunit 8 n=1 Tax=Paracoccidioides lutzii (strain ATCC MYA-826 / Pb01) TaxID=502779 RepID=A0A0A2V2A9_PARBA|nr:hypothetical protein PAAG_11605 [Paracoccidioides lutzii Pb01]KGQ01623.1 hypothetical protein PAAG_11605 [Paracoccidioides lutzii Pb01]